MCSFPARVDFRGVNAPATAEFKPQTRCGGGGWNWERRAFSPGVAEQAPAHPRPFTAVFHPRSSQRRPPGPDRKPWLGPSSPQVTLKHRNHCRKAESRPPKRGLFRAPGWLPRWRSHGLWVRTPCLALGGQLRACVGFCVCVCVSLSLSAPPPLVFSRSLSKINIRRIFLIKRKSEGFSSRKQREAQSLIIKCPVNE